MDGMDIKHIHQIGPHSTQCIDTPLLGVLLAKPPNPHSIHTTWTIGPIVDRVQLKNHIGWAIVNPLKSDGEFKIKIFLDKYI